MGDRQAAHRPRVAPNLGGSTRSRPVREQRNSLDTPAVPAGRESNGDAELQGQRSWHQQLQGEVANAPVKDYGTRAGASSSMGAEAVPDAAFCSVLWSQLQEAMANRARVLEIRERAVAINMRWLKEEAEKLHSMKDSAVERLAAATEAEKRAEVLRQEARDDFQRAAKEADCARALHQRIQRDQEELDKRTDEVGTQEAELHFKQERFSKEQAEFEKKQVELSAALQKGLKQPVPKTRLDGSLPPLLNHVNNGTSATKSPPATVVQSQPISNPQNGNGSAPVKAETSTSKAPQEECSGSEGSDVPIGELRDRSRLAITARPEASSNPLGWAASYSQKRKDGMSKAEKRQAKKPRVRCAKKALDEDAPELLQALREKGVLDDMELFEIATEHDEVTGKDSLEALSYQALGQLLARIYEKGPGQDKYCFSLASITSNTNKPRYCVDALQALIEEAQALKGQGQPVSWGWCRKLRSFIFVFPAQNRLILERPEYGHATYFFEAESPRGIKSQVQRLIAVLSAPSVGRNDLLENNPLEVGHRLTEEEARLLVFHGWQRGTGLGSFLNYDSRIVHDARNSESIDGWRSKIKGHLIRAGRSQPRLKPLSTEGFLELPSLESVKVELTEQV